MTPSLNVSVTDENQVAVCCVCHSSHATTRNPLVPVIDTAADDDESEECIHLACARTSPEHGLCWCCEAQNVTKVFAASALNSASECSDHAGESVPDYPEEDADSYIEHVQNH
jgi:hypothetical protein